MHYGRTVIELIVAQVVILGTCLLVPFDVMASLGTVGAGIVSMAVAGVVASVIFMRHRSRLANRDMEVKLKTLRHSPAA